MQRFGSGALLVAFLAVACGDSSSDSRNSGGGGEGGSASGGESLGGGGTPSSTAPLCVDIINDYRASINLPPLARWTDGEACADGEAASDAASNTPHGAFGTCGEFAQNECPGWPGPPETMIDACLEMMWAEGPGEDFALHGHYINMANPDYTKVACGFATLDDGSVWSVQNFQ